MAIKTIYCNSVLRSLYFLKDNLLIFKNRLLLMILSPRACRMRRKRDTKSLQETRDTLIGISSRIFVNSFFK